jgi:uncharacterized membrane protein
MPHCTKCGTEVGATAQFCPTCGQPQPPVPAAPSPIPPVAGSQSGMTENTAAALSYVLGWITGIIFYVIDKRPYVRFHAAQSMITFGVLHIIRMVLAMIFGVGFLFGGYHHMGYGGWGTFGLGLGLLSVFSLLTFVLWLVCIVKAASGSRFMLPIAGPIAENMSR